MTRKNLIKGLAATVTILALATAAYATASVYVSPGLKYLGYQLWNSSETSQVIVRVQNTTASDTVLYVDVKARAEDGSTVGNRVYLGLRPYEGRQVPVQLSKRIGNLVFIQIVKIR